MRVATSPGKISRTAKIRKETSNKVKSARTRRWAINRATNTVIIPLLSAVTAAGGSRRLNQTPGGESPRGVVEPILFATGQIFEVQIEVLRPRRVAGTAFAQCQHLMD